MARTSEEEFAQFWANLSPSEQQQFQYTFGMSPQDQAGALTAGFPTQPTFDFGQDLGNVFDAALPQLTTKGAVDPYDLSQAMSRLNYTQDVGGSMFDLAQTMFAGPDAWGDPSAFEPITTYSGKAVPAIQGEDGTMRPATVSARMLDDYTTNGGYEAFIADAVRSGMTASQAVAQMRDLVERGANASDPKLRETALQIRNTLPVRTEETTDQFGAPTAPVDRATAAWNKFDEKGMIDFATGLYKGKVEDDMSSATLQFDPKTGQYYESVETEDSPTALKFRNAGLPTPFERFDDPEYIEKAMQAIQPGYQNEVAAHQQDVGQQATDWNALAEEYTKQSRSQGDLRQAWNQSQPKAPDPLLAGLGNRGAGTPAQPSVGRYASASPQMMAPSKTMPTTTALSPIRPTSPAQQASQMEGSLASQFRINPAEVTPDVMGRAGLGPLGGAQPLTWNAPETEAPPVFYVGDDNTPHLITRGEGVRFGPEGPPVRFGNLNRGDMKNAAKKTNTARKKATDAYTTMQRQASQGAPGDYERAYNAQLLRGQARTGQTPLQVAMLARLASLGQRAGLGG